MDVSHCSLETTVLIINDVCKWYIKKPEQTS